ncbi:hypothetical protein YC2023_072630 [Brassica napus]
MALVSSSRSMEKQVFGFTFHSLMLVKAIGFTRPGGGHDVLNLPGFGVNLDNSYNTASFSHRTRFSIVFILAVNSPGLS